MSVLITYVHAAFGYTALCSLRWPSDSLSDPQVAEGHPYAALNLKLKNQIIANKMSSQNNSAQLIV